MLLRTRIFVLFCCFAASEIHASETQWEGRPIGDFVAYLGAQGLKVIYSSDVLLDSFVVQAEPQNDELAAALLEVLAPYGLLASPGPGNSWLVIRNPTQLKNEQLEIDGRAQSKTLPEIVVSSSVYSVRYQKSGSHVFLERDFIAGLPDVGEETLSAVARLPGIANGGVSARNHIRGGAANEQLILFDGLRLYEPYHLKDFHAVASTIDPSAVDGVDVYTAGYQVRYGDRMSGVVNIGMREPPQKRETELGISFFNTWGLSTGRFGSAQDGDWLVSARRSNLDQLSRVLNPDLGSPGYSDTLLHIGWQWQEHSYLSANFLYSYDDIDIAQEDDSEEASARYINRVAWLKIQTTWSANVSSSTILSATDIDNRRSGQSAIPGVLLGDVNDSRDFSSFALSQDWDFALNKAWTLKAGMDFKFLNADYDYESTLQIFSPFDQIFNNESTLQRETDLSPSGEQFAIYTEARWRPTDNLVFDVGLRWDKQTYSESFNSEQGSPRFNALYKFGIDTEFRVGVGRFYQAQEINELQVSDGETSFFSPQFADHVVASVVHRVTPKLSLRAEYYRKDYDRPMPRFENLFNALVIIPELQIDRARIDARNSFVKGVELTISGNEEGLSWWASYTWSSTEDKVAGRSAKRSWDQKHSITAGISGQWRSWDISAAGSWHAGWPKTELLIETTSLPGGTSGLVATTTPINSSNYGNFRSLDLRASKTFQLSKGELEAFIEVSNIANRRNQCCTRYTVRTKDNGESEIHSEKDHWLPLVPSLGVVWRF